MELKDGDKVLDTKEITLSDTEQQHVDLTFEAKRPGSRTLTVKAIPSSELPEDLKENNSDSVVVRAANRRVHLRE